MYIKKHPGRYLLFYSVTLFALISKIGLVVLLIPEESMMRGSELDQQSVGDREFRADDPEVELCGFFYSHIHRRRDERSRVCSVPANEAVCSLPVSTKLRRLNEAADKAAPAERRDSPCDADGGREGGEGVGGRPIDGRLPLICPCRCAPCPRCGSMS